jgi:hypothetical protein
MTTHEDEGGGEAGLFVGGSVSALRGLVDPPRLSEEQLSIIGWYGRLVKQLAGPSSGDERGPAKEPPWVRQGPRIDNARLGTEEARLSAILVEGSGFATTSGVWVDGRVADGWRVLGNDSLLIELADEFSDEVEILIRTSDGDAAARIDVTAL